MNYAALIQNRKSVREFSDKYVSFADMDKIKTYHRMSVRRLIPQLQTELRLFGLDARAVLEGAAGYQKFLVGSPQYMVLLSEKDPYARINGGYVMEDLILKLEDLDQCYALFSDLCTEKEIEKMAERVYAAQLLLEGKTYNQVMAQSNISSATLSRVSRSVQYGQGYSKFLKK